MKVKRIQLGVRSVDEVLEETAATMKAVAASKPITPKGCRLFFTSAEALRRFLTPKRLELIRLIRQQQPVSIHALAVLAHRDFKRVYEDVKDMASAGLIELGKAKGRQLTPRVADELRLEIVV